MKHFILAAAAIVMSGSAMAQKTEVGLNAGGSYTQGAYVNGVAPAFSVKGIYNVCSGFQVGLSSSFTWLSYETQMFELYFQENGSQAPMGPVYTTNSQLVHNIKAFANAKRSICVMDFYAGVSGGYIHTLADKTLTIGTNTMDGFTVGAQAGATYYITKKLGINLEAGADYINMRGDLDLNREIGKTNLSTWNFPVTVGIRYKLSCICPKSCPMSKGDAGE